MNIIWVLAILFFAWRLFLRILERKIPYKAACSRESEDCCLSARSDSQYLGIIDDGKPEDLRREPKTMRISIETPQVK